MHNMQNPYMNELAPSTILARSMISSRHALIKIRIIEGVGGANKEKIIDIVGFSFFVWVFRCILWKMISLSASLIDHITPTSTILFPLLMIEVH